jgi:hypothetical protein
MSLMTLSGWTLLDVYLMQAVTYQSSTLLRPAPSIHFKIQTKNKHGMELANFCQTIIS